jgi:hypothetical protein
MTNITVQLPDELLEQVQSLAGNENLQGFLISEIEHEVERQQPSSKKQKISWKSKNGNSLKPKILLKKIENLTTVGELPGSKTFQEYWHGEHKGTQVYFSGPDYYSALMALMSMVKLPENAYGIDLEELVRAAICNMAISKKDFPSNFIEEINNLLKAQLATRPEKYYLLTTISIADGFSLSEQLIDDSCRLTLFNGDYPKVYTSREIAIRECNPEQAITHEGYSKIIVCVEDKSAQRAVYRSFRAIDLTRAILALEFNPEIDLYEAVRPGPIFHSNSFAPINTIQIGKFHTLHDSQGETNKDLLWEELNFAQCQVRPIPDPEKVEKYFLSFLQLLGKCKYADDIKESLIQYVRSLDTGEHDANFIRLWGVLERLTTNRGDRANHEAVVRRCASIFEEKEYHQQILEHLRSVRNNSVHDGTQSDKPKIHCYELQKYIRKMIQFHLKMADVFKSKDESLQFLDLPHDGDELLKRKRLVDEAAKSRGLSS